MNKFLMMALFFACGAVSVNGKSSAVKCKGDNACKQEILDLCNMDSDCKRLFLLRMGFAEEVIPNVTPEKFEEMVKKSEHCQAQGDNLSSDAKQNTEIQMKEMAATTEEEKKNAADAKQKMENMEKQLKDMLAKEQAAKEIAVDAKQKMENMEKQLKDMLAKEQTEKKNALDDKKKLEIQVKELSVKAEADKKKAVADAIAKLKTETEKETKKQAAIDTSATSRDRVKRIIPN